ncbi:hypothetical protein GWR56_01805 [Mucilaginibacter sp. 14171R-50]|uniref:M56 family metallopeptidase n=1 Tax=Mucilaginibacter sp. 14171R-50 TaxID=2703789 RepID=UPI00138D0CC6|nr:M56 family metallopeptidase [Mucilaginibacter sp. 14171R-50]QHS54337.1 hypothetical protein GWR56_01805 [Mucilaginibacter sp. 14171R-50]
MNVLALTETAQHFIRSFSWMLIHSLWQGLLLALLTMFLLMINGKASAAIRYRIVLSQTVLFLLACGLTLIMEWNDWQVEPIVPGVSGGNSNLHMGFISFTQYFTENAPLVVLLWSLMFLFRTVRLINGLVYLQYARHRMVCSPDEDWNNRFLSLCRKIRLRRTVRLLESGLVQVPVVIGHLKPVILMPLGMLAGIPAGQVEAVLLHELAHIRRNDYIINLFQTLAETVFFFNPGLLWLCALLRDERENCCDDIALAQTKDKRGFVEALITFKEYALYGKNFQTAFPGKQNQLLNRVSRIIHGRQRMPAPADKIFCLSGLIVLVALFAAFTVTKAPVAPASYHETPAIRVVSVAKQTPGSAAKQKVLKAKAHTAKRRARHEPPGKLGARKSVRQVVQPTVQPQVTQWEAANNALQQQRNQEQEQKNKQQAELNEQQAAKNAVQAMLNVEQAKNNEKQRIRNEEQADRNREQAKRNELQARKNAESLSRQK